MAAECADDGPVRGINTGQAEIDDLPTLRLDWDSNAELLCEGIRPGASGDDDTSRRDPRPLADDSSD